MKTFVFAGAMIAASLAGHAAAQDHCPKALYAKADAVADGVKTWPKLYAFYKAYGVCANDGGEIAEGVSDHVAKLLAYHWADVGTVSQPLQGDKGFRGFVVDFIDSTWDWNDSVPARKNAASHCPTGLGVFCKAIVARIDYLNAHPGG